MEVGSGWIADLRWFGGNGKLRRFQTFLVLAPERVRP
jgi:hypothetical protein